MKQRLLMTVVFSLIVVVYDGAAYAFHPLNTDVTSMQPQIKIGKEKSLCLFLAYDLFKIAEGLLQ